MRKIILAIMIALVMTIPFAYADVNIIQDDNFGNCFTDDTWVHPDNLIVKDITKSITENDLDNDEIIDSVYIYLKDNVKYDWNKYDRIQSGDKSYTDEFYKGIGVGDISTLVSGKGVCSDYAFAMDSMLKSKGIDSYVMFGIITIDGKDYNHAWNLVYYRHEWVQIDATNAVFDADYTGKFKTKIYMIFK